MAIEMGKTKKRKPLNAIVLSLIMPGLGHVYCGRIVKGLLLTFLSSIFVPIILITLMFDVPIKMVIIGMSILASLAVAIMAIIDSYYVAKHAKLNYELKEYNRWYVYLLLILISAGGSTEVASNVKSNYFEAFRVPVAANYPTIVPNDRFLANKLAYRSKNPKRGDMIVFINPENRRQNFIKRVVAVAGDTIEIKDNEVHVNNEKLEIQKLPQKMLDNIRIKINGKPLEGDVFYEINGNAKYKIFLAKPPHDKLSHDFAKTTVPEHHCFVLGDNRNFTRDSRHVGPIPLATIKGKADYLYCPSKDWSRFGKISK
ncbi:MAG: signal peptidase I [Planctomycetes bacterium]|nr:signal peptidase I [Planctomycetota bacterium]MBL7106132.1 signal peptidase I [Phycisphaerae bacterium]